jgi:rubrerythrin
MLVGLLAIVVAVDVIRRLDRIRRLRKQHVCYHCGYDLTGNVSGICPECGMSVDPP